VGGPFAYFLLSDRFFLRYDRLGAGQRRPSGRVKELRPDRHNVAEPPRSSHPPVRTRPRGRVEVVDCPAKRPSELEPRRGQPRRPLPPRRAAKPAQFTGGTQTLPFIWQACGVTVSADLWLEDQPGRISLRQRALSLINSHSVAHARAEALPSGRPGGTPPPPREHGQEAGSSVSSSSGRTCANQRRARTAVAYDGQDPAARPRTSAPARPAVRRTARQRPVL